MSLLHNFIHRSGFFKRLPGGIIKSKIDGDLLSPTMIGGPSGVHYVSPHFTEENGYEAPFYSDPQDAEDAAASGELVKYYPGAYGRLILKNGVNKDFEPGVSFASSDTGGTITDNGVAVVQQWKGEPLITNSNGLDKRIVLSHADSRVEGFWWEGRFYFDPEAGIAQYKNTIGVPPETNAGIGLKLTFPHIVDKIEIVTTPRVLHDDFPPTVAGTSWWDADGVLTINGLGYQSDAGTLINPYFPPFYCIVRVYP